MQLQDKKFRLPDKDEEYSFFTTVKTEVHRKITH